LRAPTLYLAYIDTSTVEFDAYSDTNHRRAVVKVGSGSLRFPHSDNDAGETFGDAAVDLTVLRRANEELVRYRSHRDAA